MKYLLLVLALPLLFACTAEPIDFKHANIANGIFYSKKTGKPFTGTITNVPDKTFAKDDFYFVFNTYNSFFKSPGSVDLEQVYSKYNDVMCTIEVKDGVLNGKTECRYNLYFNIQDLTNITLEATYKDGYIADSNTYQSVNDQKIKVMTSVFTGNEYNHFDMTLFKVDQPDVVRMSIAKRPDKTTLDYNSPKGTLLTHTEITETSSQRDQYDPKTGEKLGTLNFIGSKPLLLSEESNGYYFSYGTNPDSLETTISEVRFFKNGFDVISKEYQDNEPFNMVEFNQQIKESTQAWENLNNTNEREINSQTFSDIFFENQQREYEASANEMASDAQ